MRVRPGLLLENGAIGIGLVSFWPYIFGCRHILYLASLPVVLAWLGVVAILRFRRVKHALEEYDVEKGTADNRHHPA